MEEETLSLPEKELAEFDASSSWPVVYHRLKNSASVVYQTLTYKIARKPENRNRNRYRDVSPYDHSRVQLINCDEDETDYVNANIVEAPEAGRKYILTQGPLRNTSAHFWQMIWEQDSRAIIMLNRVIERETIKCDQYWPLGSDVGDDNEYCFDSCGLKVTLKEEKDMGYYITRVFLLEDMKTSRCKEVLHFHYTTWPDFYVPQSPAAFLNFLYAVRRSGSLGKDVGPAVIHCSAGIGRSGTFCLVDTCLVMIERTKTMKELDIQQVLLSMRKYRMGLIQTADQLRFSYLAVIMGGSKILQDGAISDSYQFTIEDGVSLPQPPVRKIPPRRLLESENEDDDSDLDGFIQDDDGGPDSDDEDYNDIPPPLPPRTYRSNSQPPEKEKSANDLSSSGDMTSSNDVSSYPSLTKDDEEFEKRIKPEEEEFEKRVKADDDEIFEKRIRTDDDYDDDHNSTPQFGIRRRNREDRKKNTQKQLELMRERQKAAEIRRGFWTSWKPLAVGGALGLLAAYASYQTFVYMAGR